MDEQLAGGLRNVQIVFKEPLDGKQGLLIERFDGTFLEHLAQEHLAKGGGKLVNQAGNAEIVIADNGFLGIKHLADLQGDLRFLKGAGQILDAGDAGADADDGMDIELAAQRIHDGAGQLFQIL